MPAMESTNTLSPVILMDPLTCSRNAPVAASLNCTSLSVTLPLSTGFLSVPATETFPIALPPTSVTAAVNCGIRPIGRLSDASVTLTGRSSRRLPVTPDSARSIGTVPFTLASTLPVESTAVAFVVSCLLAYENVPCSSGTGVSLYVPFTKSSLPATRGSSAVPVTCASRFTRPVSARSLWSSSATFSTAKSVTWRSKFAVPFVGSSPLA